MYFLATKREPDIKIGMHVLKRNDIGKKLTHTYKKN